METEKEVNSGREDCMGKRLEAKKVSGAYFLEWSQALKSWMEIIFEIKKGGGEP